MQDVEELSLLKTWVTLLYVLNKLRIDKNEWQHLTALKLSSVLCGSGQSSAVLGSKPSMIIAAVKVKVHKK